MLVHAQQDEAIAEALAGVLAASDARNYDGPLFRTASRNPDRVVRTQVALALGRIGQRSATPLLLDMLADRDSAVAATAAFALGLLKDPAALAKLRSIAVDETGQWAVGVQVEAIAAIARIGGADAARTFADLLTRWAGSAGLATIPAPVTRALAEAWRLAADAPVAAVLAFATSPDPQVRWRATYSVGRLKAQAAADLLLAATEDSVPLIRATAVRELTVAYADSTRLDRGALSSRVRRLVADSDAYVRVSALRALGTYGTEALTPAVVERLSDPDLNVRVQALTALGQLRGPQTADELDDYVDEGPFAIRRQALLSLARASAPLALERLAKWRAEVDWRFRATAAEALGLVGGDSGVAALEVLARDKDGRVAAAAASALVDVDSARAYTLLRTMTRHDDPIVRTLAAARLAAREDTTELPLLLDLYARGIRDPFPDARIAAVTALGRVARSAGGGAVATAVLQRFPTCDDYLVRRTAAAQFPQLAAVWGPAEPIVTGRARGDYRDIARRLVLPAARGGPTPGLVIETDRGSASITLFPAEAPLTVNAFLRLADRGFFDGGTWHRVVPGFVAQDGDPRGDGFGGPGFALRDEVSRQRYGAWMVGLALDGPDTGSSQFFITLTPQPHLDAIYPLFGQVESGFDVISGVTQGDRIRRVRRR